MTDRLPWFRCFPSPLLGAVAGMQADEAYVYIVILLRIYETGGAVVETPRTMARRAGLPERKVVAAIEGLIAAGKLQQLPDGRLDSASTHEEIAWQNERRDGQSKAGRASAAKRAAKHGAERELAAEEKHQQNQQTEATSVERTSNHKEKEEEKEKPKEKEPAPAPRSDGRPPLGGGRAPPNSPDRRSGRRRAPEPPADVRFAKRGTLPFERWRRDNPKAFLEHHRGDEGRWLPVDVFRALSQPEAAE